MGEREPKDVQMDLDFETIHGALCWDGTAPEGKEISRQDLVRIGEEEFVNSGGDLYAPAIRREVDKEQKYVFQKKKDVPEDVQKEMAHLKERFSDRTWVDLYLMARRDLAWAPPPVGTRYDNEHPDFK